MGSVPKKGCSYTIPKRQSEYESIALNSLRSHDDEWLMLRETT